MSGTGRRREITQILLLSVFVSLLSILPPETRGESMAGCAVLAVLLAIVSVRHASRIATVSYLCLALASAWPLAVTAQAPGRAVEPLAVLYLAAAIGLFTAALPRRSRGSRAIPVALSAAASLIAAHALYDRFWGLARKASAVEAAGAIPDRDAVLARLSAGRAFEPFATPATLGGFLAISLAVTLGLAWKRKGRDRRLWWVLAGLQVCGLLATASATAVGALLGAAVLAALVRKKTRRWAVIAVMAAALLLVAVIALRGDEILSPDDPNHPVRLRAGNVRIAAEMAADHPWTGVGPGNYGEMYPLYRKPGDNESQHAHNLPMEWVAEYGILPGSVLGIVFLLVFLAPLMRLRGVGEEEPWKIGAAVGLASFALHNLADFTALFPSILWIAALLRGTMAEESPDRQEGGYGIAAALAAAGVLAAAVVAAGSGLSWNALKSAELAVAGGDSERARTVSHRAVRLAPWDVDARMLHAGALLSDPPDIVRSRREIEKAIVLSPVRPSARALRARIRHLQGDLAGALADYHEASRLYPLRKEYEVQAERYRRVFEGEAP